MIPGFIAIPLDAKTDFEILVVSNLISMTPGTLSVDVSPDRKYLYLHVMYIDDLDAIRHTIKSKFESRVLEVLRS
jgi:multicomponent Na+:H+ antiporter subunit E